ncbi:MAG TPA: response regulator [Anaerolineae bacterium]|nr:response regulator [Anaerolineae bacterium]
MSVPRENKKIRVLIVDDISETRDNLKKLLYFEDDIEIIGSASNGREGVEQAAALRPDIVLMDINMPGMDGIQASELISQQDPTIQVVMMSVQGEADYLRRSMLAGAREFLIKPFSSEELAHSLRRVYQLAATRRAIAPPPATPPPDGNPPSPVPQKPLGAKIIAVYSPKGGVGVSTIAVNLAVALREETRARVALLDTSLQFGDVGVLLNLASGRTFADIVEAKHDPDEDLLNGVLVAHSTGIKALLAPPRPEIAELVTADHIRKTLAVLQKMFDYIVIDTGKGINDPLLAVFDASEQIILLSTADISSLKDAKLFFEVAQALEYPASKTLLILNKYDGKTGIHARDVEGNIKHAVTGVIARDDKATALALTRGIPVVLTQRGNAMSQAIFAMARMLKREAPPVPVAAPAPVRPAAPQPSPRMQPTKPKRRFLLFGRTS